MGSPAAGLAWTMWRRYRRSVSALLLYGALLAAALQWVPPIAFGRSLAIVMTAPILAGLVYLMVVCSAPDADMVSEASAYPSHLLILPVRTFELAFWPMLYGTSAVAAGWVALSRLFFGSPVIDVSTSVWWPAAMLAAVVACLQGIFWMPFGVPYVRAGLAMGVVPLLIYAGVDSAMRGVPAANLAAKFIAIIPVAYAAGFVAVTLARRGDSVFTPGSAAAPAAAPTPAPASHAVSATARRHRPFASPARAQLWYEWRRNGLHLPLVVTTVLTLFLLPLFRVLAAIWGLVLTSANVAEIQARILIVYGAAVLAVPPLVGLIVGCGLRNFDGRRSSGVIGSFQATRPLTSAALVMTKLKSAALSALATWAVILVYAAVWLLLVTLTGQATNSPARHLYEISWRAVGAEGPLGRRLVTDPGLGFACLAVATIFSLIGLTWKVQVSWLFIDLSGRPWLVTGFRIALFLAVLFSLAMVYPDHCSQLLSMARYVSDAGPGPAILAALFKVVVGGWVLLLLWKDRLIGIPTIGLIMAAWLTVTAGLLLLLHTLVPEAMVSHRIIDLAVVMFVPLVRVSAAPLALARSRHV